MRKLAVKIIQLLDGTPAVYGKRQAGQSVVELALITPILIILLAGLVEIGWFANNYLNLLDVSRTGARRGSVLPSNMAPQFWDNRFSYVPNSLFAAQTPPVVGYGMPNLTTPIDTGSDAQRFLYRWMPDRSVPGSYADTCVEYDELNPSITFDRAFYNEIICTMITSIEPLTLEPLNGIDDIVVSAFSLQLIDATVHTNFLAPSYDRSKLQMVVVGRYPTNANECDVASNGALFPGGREGRDPFDFNVSGGRDVKPFPWSGPIDGVNDFTELEGYDAIGGTGVVAEKQVGFSLYGNHKIDNTRCVGSEWTMAEIEDLMNADFYFNQDGTVGTGPLNVSREYLPSQGVVMVEIFWEHEMLLKIPLLSPVFTAVGNQDGKMVISVWAAFPLASVEPHIQFP